MKKACSKATKRSGPAPTPAKEVDLAPAASSNKEAKQAKKDAAALKAELKAAENEMMDAQRKLRIAKAGGDVMAGAHTVQGSVETFVQQITARAITGSLEAGDMEHLKERVEADIAALAWVRLAQRAGVLAMTEDIAALGCEMQLARLKEARAPPDLSRPHMPQPPQQPPARWPAPPIAAPRANRQVAADRFENARLAAALERH